MRVYVYRPCDIEGLTGKAKSTNRCGLAHGCQEPGSTRKGVCFPAVGTAIVCEELGQVMFGLFIGERKQWNVGGIAAIPAGAFSHLGSDGIRRGHWS